MRNFLDRIFMGYIFFIVIVAVVMWGMGGEMSSIILGVIIVLAVSLVIGLIIFVIAKIKNRGFMQFYREIYAIEDPLERIQIIKDFKAQGRFKKLHESVYPNLLSVAYSEACMYEEALKVIDENPPSPKSGEIGLYVWHYNKSLYCIKLGDVQQAREVFDKSEEIYQKWNGASWQIKTQHQLREVEVLLLEEKYDEARAALNQYRQAINERTAENAPERLPILYNEARLDINNEQWGIARRKLDSILEDPNATWALKHEAGLLLEFVLSKQSEV